VSGLYDSQSAEVFHENVCTDIKVNGKITRNMMKDRKDLCTLKLPPRIRTRELREMEKLKSIN
jgi:hypothetical protein